MSLPVVSDIDEAWNVLTTWARDWCETYDLRGPNGAWTWVSVCHWLGEHYATTAADHPALADFDDEVTAEERRLRRHLGDDPRTWQTLPGRPRCPLDGCTGLLLEHVADHVVRCRACGETWREDAYELLGRMLGQDYAVTVDQAAAWARVNRRTINRWIEAGYVPVIPGTPRLLDRRDVTAFLLRQVTS